MPPQSPGAALARFHHGGDENQQQNGKQVFHYQPSQSHMAAGRMEVLVVFQHPRQHYGTRHGNRHAKNQSGNRGPSEHPPDQHSQHGSHGYLHNGSRDGHFLHGNQILQMEMEPHPKHQQDNAQLRKLFHRMGIRNKSRRVRPYHHPGQQVAHQRG